MMAGFKVMIMSFMERAMSLAEQFDPLWVLPAWLRTMIMTTVQFFLAVASVVAIVLYRNQVRGRAGGWRRLVVCIVSRDLRAHVADPPRALASCIVSDALPLNPKP
jgi:hypothetical protein